MSESPESVDRKKRDFLLQATTGTVAAAGILGAAVPFIGALGPSQDVLALASTEVNLEPIAAGQRITVVFQGKPVFVAHRTEEEIRAAAAVSLKDLKDPATDAARAVNPRWLVVVGVCPHLGCVPLGQTPDTVRGDFGGWFCPCHGSVFDTSGRIRQGPAPTNLEVPPYSFLSETVLKLG